MVDTKESNKVVYYISVVILLIGVGMFSYPILRYYNDGKLIISGLGLILIGIFGLIEYAKAKFTIEINQISNK